VKIGPFSIIGANVRIGDNCEIGNHVTLCENTFIGNKCKIFHFASIGEIPQDLKFCGEKTITIIGDNTVIREYVTVNRGTDALKKTEIGSNVLLMASSHVAHDCIVGDNVIMSNLSTLGGHVTVGKWAVLGGGVLVHQFSKIGEHSFIGGGFRAVQDVPPYILAAEEPLKFQGINKVGLKRRGFSLDDRKIIKNVYKIFFLSKQNRKDALLNINAQYPDNKIVKNIVSFISLSERGII
tara:strand:+ start:141 stop:854 length:714 start_codon:yes stop_codon:yes gene_type:complete